MKPDYTGMFLMKQKITGSKLLSGFSNALIKGLKLVYRITIYVAHVFWTMHFNFEKDSLCVCLNKPVLSLSLSLSLCICMQLMAL